MRVAPLFLAVALSSWLLGGPDAAAQLKLPGLELPKPAAEPPPPQKSADAAAPIAALAIPDRAREADTALRHARQLRDAPELERIAIGVPHLWEEISELSRVSSTAPIGSRRRGLYDLILRWEALQKQLARWQQLVQRRTAALEAQQQAIQALSKTWTATSVALHSDARTPRVVLAKVTQVLRELAEADDFLSAGAERKFELQDRLRAAEEALDSNLARVRDELETDHDGLLRKGGQPIWKLLRSFAAGDLPPPRAHVEYVVAGLRYFLQQYGRRLPLDACLFLAFIGAAVLFARRVRARTHRPDQPESDILRAPAMGALLIALVIARFFYPDATFTVLDLLGISSLLPLWFLAPLLVRHHEIVLPVRANLGVLALHRAVMLLHVEDPWHNLAVMLVGALLWATAYLFWRTRLRLKLALAPTVLDRRLALFVRVSLLGLGVALGAGLLGYDSLLELLMDGFTSSIYWVLVAVALTRVLYAFFAAALDSGVVKRLGSMRNHGELIRARTLIAARLVGIALWTGATLYAFDLIEPVFEGLAHLFGTRAQFGSWSISLGDLARFALTMYLASSAARLVGFVLDEDLLPRLNLARGLPPTISRLSRYVVLAFGFLLAVGAAGVNMSQIALLASALSVGIGFGLQNVVNNFVSGLILIFERPIRIGDTVQLGDLVGEVRKIGIRASTMRTAQGAEVILPNAELISNRVINWTLSDFKRRIEIPVGVAYGSDPTSVMEIVTSAVAEIEEIERFPEPVCIFMGFGQSSLDFELRTWVRRTEDWPNVRSAVLVAVCRKLGEAGIEIPFPQSDLHLRSVDEAAAKLLLARP
jgi:potassium efflux system protein